ncbi:hypothetical protein Y695_04395 [Hydrogenophaga sp. T4]|nr:hypothetical protein Y695_04395 [Hydrogenophaga sp. T4]
MGLAAVAGLLASALLVLLLDHLMLQRLQRLHADLKGITEHGPSASGWCVCKGMTNWPSWRMGSTDCCCACGTTPRCSAAPTNGRKRCRCS